jgi:ABC-type methionine transport system permease subunit
MAMYFVFLAIVFGFLTGLALGSYVYERREGKATNSDIATVVVSFLLTIFFLICAQLSR